MKYSFVMLEVPTCQDSSRMTLKSYFYVWGGGLRPARCTAMTGGG